MPDMNMYNLYCQVEKEAHREPLKFESWRSRELNKRKAQYKTDFRVLMTGSRVWRDNDRMYWALFQLYAGIQLKNAVLVHGDAIGADTMAAKFWRRMGGKTEPHPVARDRIEQLGKKAFYLRNKEMVDLGADICIAFIKGGSAGATMTAKLAEDAGIRTIRIEEK